MKFAIIIFSFLLTTLSYNAQKQKVKFTFIDGCTHLIKSGVEFDLLTIESFDDYHYSISKRKDIPKKIKKNERYLNEGEYLLKAVIVNKNYKESFEQRITITKETKRVKIIIPKLILRTSLLRQDLNSFENYQNYYYCGELCNGSYVDYYTKNKKRIEGEFRNGKPIRLINYAENNKSKVVELFNNEWQPLKIEKYDEQGNKIETTEYVYKKKYILVKKYNSENKLIEKNKYSRY